MRGVRTGYSCSRMVRTCQHAQAQAQVHMHMHMPLCRAMPHAIVCPAMHAYVCVHVYIPCKPSPCAHPDLEERDEGR
jgi:hypothetical protein